MNVVETELRDAVAWAFLNRAHKLNAIDRDMLARLHQTVARVDADPAVRAVVIAGRGRAFCTGGDIAEMAAMDDRVFADTIARYADLARAIHAAAKPIIAAIHGYALAGGFELALLYDIRIAAAGTVFRLPDATLGLSPTSGMTHLLPHVIGLGRALDLALLADNIDAAEAHRIGLVTRVCAPDALHDEAARSATRIAAMPRVGVTQTRRLLRAGLDHNFADAAAAELASELECFADPTAADKLRSFARRRG
jgi:enoyl-CoA hydratase/carnithine racemase